eukprot:COSAG04_NODE_12738_length_637_cov_1.256506_1_plen_138_part_10
MTAQTGPRPRPSPRRSRSRSPSRRPSWGQRQRRAKKKPNTKQVQLYSANTFEKLRTLELTSQFDRLVFSPDGSQLAVTVDQPAGVLIFSAGNDWADPPLRLGTPDGKDREWCQIGPIESSDMIGARYSPDGSLLIVTA